MFLFSFLRSAGSWQLADKTNWSKTSNGKIEIQMICLQRFEFIGVYGIQYRCICIYFLALHLVVYFTVHLLSAMDINSIWISLTEKCPINAIPNNQRYSSISVYNEQWTMNPVQYALYICLYVKHLNNQIWIQFIFKQNETQDRTEWT